MKIYDSIDQLIGHTPLLRLKKTQEQLGLKATLIVKLEYFNPGGSVKDRVGLAMIEQAEKLGKLNKDTVIIEPTSGNTGIGIALVATSRGYKTVIVMPETMSIERQKLIKAYGAQLVLTDGSKGMAGAIQKADELVKEYGNAILAGQFVNPANPLAHYMTTAREIWDDTDGEVDIFVAGIGTGGTLSGVGKYLKEKKPTVRIVGVEPSSSPVITQGKGGAHKIQGIGAGFIPSTLDTSVYDEIITVNDEDAMSASRELSKREGVLVGISSGAALQAAIEIAKRSENEGKTVVAVLPDTGERYLSTELFS
ncbi:MAG: cysteine synthase A [Clostridia bacterium]|nr:cysteine synthase A [Clostridia bacterium]